MIGTEWRRNGIALEVLTPGKSKKPVLILKREAIDVEFKLATFGGELEAQAFIELFREMFDGLIEG